MLIFNVSEFTRAINAVQVKQSIKAQKVGLSDKCFMTRS